MSDFDEARKRLLESPTCHRMGDVLYPEGPLRTVQAADLLLMLSEVDRLKAELAAEREGRAAALAGHLAERKRVERLEKALEEKAKWFVDKIAERERFPFGYYEILLALRSVAEQARREEAAALQALLLENWKEYDTAEGLKDAVLYEILRRQGVSNG